MKVRFLDNKNSFSMFQENQEMEHKCLIIISSLFSHVQAEQI